MKLKINLDHMQSEFIIKNKKLATSILIKKNYIANFIKEIAKRNELVFCVIDSKIKTNLNISKKKNLKFIYIKCGETIKTIDGYRILTDKLIKNNINRKSVIIAIGGGTLGDLTGFVASTFKRGSDLILLPTTLLAMVDAAIGGKNGVNLSSNHGNLKNQIGTFHLPKFIGLNASWLESLPERELRSGKSEMIKHALLFGEKNYIDQVLNTEISELEGLIVKSAQIKQNIVGQDLFEKVPELS